MKLSEFQTRIKGGVRPNLYKVNFDFPTTATVDADSVSYLCKSAAIPASTVGTVELPFRGRVIKVPGDRTFESWTATFYNDIDWKLRNAFEEWVDLTNAKDENNASKSVGDVFKDITIEQLDKFKSGTNEPSAIAEYKLINAFPVSVSQISLAYDNNDSYEEFDVEFAYSYFTT